MPRCFFERIDMKKLISALRSTDPLSIFMLTLAGIVNAFGITIFLTPVKLYDSGISGTSMLLSQLTPSGLSLSVFLIVLNIPLFLYGLKKQVNRFQVMKMKDIVQRNDPLAYITLTEVADIFSAPRE